MTGSASPEPGERDPAEGRPDVPEPTADDPLHGDPSAGSGSPGETEAGSSEGEEDEERREPGSPGVVGEDPNRFSEEIGPLDESPDGATPSDTTRSSESSLPPG